MEFWAIAAVGVGTSVIGGAMSARSSSKAADKQAANDIKVAKLQAEEGRKTTAYEAELGDYYGQLGKQRRLDARAGTFDQYSRISKPEGYERAPVMIAKPMLPVSDDNAKNPSTKTKTVKGYATTNR